ncbi:hypothetical protein SAMN02745166_04210 [Prosthecobacter debontii]|uniref:TrbC/VIRB2 family protein n=2 Tax=Prosthecobacter debontii TaxID=48467 RepID=A0A1T4YVG6_9BACT|nr:hypothetical protein SAMN02745166_04210 [Prosthecobacter debontii]
MAGVNILRFTMPLAQAGTEEQLAGNMSGVVSILNMVGLVLAFGGLLFSAVMFMMGQTERVLYGLVGAGIGGLSFIIVKVMFNSSGGTENIENINMGGDN